MGLSSAGGQAGMRYAEAFESVFREIIKNRVVTMKCRVALQHAFSWG